jgi:calcium-dependent protein kinase
VTQHLQSAVLAYLASHFHSKKDQEKLKEIFQSFDKDGNGLLEKEELVEGYTELLGSKEAAIKEVDAIMIQVDFNQNGNIDYTGLN